MAGLSAVLICASLIACVFVLRRTQPDAPRPFRVPGYPWTPLLFIVAAIITRLPVGAEPVKAAGGIVSPGGLAFLVAGNMAIAASGQGGILVRVDPAHGGEILDLVDLSSGRQLLGLAEPGDAIVVDGWAARNGSRQAWGNSVAVKATGRILSVPVGDAFLGRVVDPLGNPLDVGFAVAGVYWLCLGRRRTDARPLPAKVTASISRTVALATPDGPAGASGFLVEVSRSLITNCVDPPKIEIANA